MHVLCSFVYLDYTTVYIFLFFLLFLTCSCVLLGLSSKQLVDCYYLFYFILGDCSRRAIVYMRLGLWNCSAH